MKNWSYRKKNIGLLILLPVTLILGYFLSFSKSIALYEENDKLETYKERELNLPLKIASLKKKSLLLDSLISINESSYQSRLVNTTNVYCEQYGTRIIEVKDFSFKQYEALPYESYKLKLEGSYKNLLQVLNEIEYNFGLGKVQSISFMRERSRKTNRTSLSLSIYLTRVITQSNLE